MAEIWPNATMIQVTVATSPRRQEDVDSWDVTHIEGVDPVNAAASDLRVVFARCQAHAEETGKVAAYTITVFGTVPGKGRRPSQTDQQLFVWVGRFGTMEPRVEDASPIASITSFVRSVPAIFDGVAQTADKTLALASRGNEMMLAQMNALVTENTSLREKLAQTSAHFVEMHRATLEHEAEERRDARRHEADMAQARQRDAFLSMIKDALTQGLQLAQARARAQSGSPKEGARADEGFGLPARIATLISSLGDRRHAVARVVGDRIWDLLVAASKASSEAEAQPMLNAVMQELRENEARRRAIVEQLVEILTQEEIDIFMEIMAKIMI